MAKKKNMVEAPAEQKKPNRVGRSKNYYLSEDLISAIEHFRKSLSPMMPSETTVVRTAIEQFLEGKGFWPPK
jgi:hypothetical protein